MNQKIHKIFKEIDEKGYLAKNLNKEYEDNYSFGDKVADKVASFGGSWKFIISFIIVLSCWFIFNTVNYDVSK